MDGTIPRQVGVYCTGKLSKLEQLSEPESEPENSVSAWLLSHFLSWLTTMSLGDLEMKAKRNLLIYLIRCFWSWCLSQQQEVNWSRLSYSQPSPLLHSFSLTALFTFSSLLHLSLSFLLSILPICFLLLPAPPPLFFSTLLHPSPLPDSSQQEVNNLCPARHYYNHDHPGFLPQAQR